MTTATKPSTTQLVDTADLVARLTIATEFLAEMRDDAVGSERTRLASKIEGMKRCAHAVEREFDVAAAIEDVEELFGKLDPGKRSITEHLSVTEHGISKGVEAALDYARNPVPAV